MYAVRAGIVTVDRELAEPVPGGAQTQAEPIPIIEPTVELAPIMERSVEPASVVEPVHGVEAAVEPTVDLPRPLHERPAEVRKIDAVTVVDEPSVAFPGTTIAQPLPVELPTTTRKLQPASASRKAWVLAIVLTTVLASILGLVLWAVQGIGGSSSVENSQTNEPSRWVSLPQMGDARAAFAVATVEGRVYVIGGEGQAGVLASVARYDASSGTWIGLSPKPTPVADVQAVKIGDKLYVPGGRRSADQADITSAFERYDPRTESWEQLPALPAPRSGYALVTFEGKLYLFGGWDGAKYRNEVFEYDPGRETWRELAPMPTARGFATAVSVEGTVYVLGGENGQGELPTNEQFTPSLGAGQSWAKLPPMPEPRSRFGTAAVVSTIYLFGGVGEASALQYNVRNEKWSSFSTPEAIGSSPGVVVVDEIITVLGGRDEASQYSNRVHGYQAIYSILLPR